MKNRAPCSKSGKLIWEKDYNMGGSTIWNISFKTSVSWSVGSISPNIQGWMEEAQDRGFCRAGARLRIVLLLGGGGSPLEFGQSPLIAGMARRWSLDNLLWLLVWDMDWQFPWGLCEVWVVLLVRIDLELGFKLLLVCLLVPLINGNNVKKEAGLGGNWMVWEWSLRAFWSGYLKKLERV